MAKLKSLSEGRLAWVWIGGVTVVNVPVSYRGDAHAGGARLEGPYLSGIDPADWREGQRIDDDEEVREGDDGVGWRACYAHDYICVAADALC
jgi:hypothetical protein